MVGGDVGSGRSTFIFLNFFPTKSPNYDPCKLTLFLLHVNNIFFWKYGIIHNTINNIINTIRTKWRNSTNICLYLPKKMLVTLQHFNYIFAKHNFLSFPSYYCLEIFWKKIKYLQQLFTHCPKIIVISPSTPLPKLRVD